MYLEVCTLYYVPFGMTIWLYMTVYVPCTMRLVLCTMYLVLCTLYKELLYCFMHIRLFGLVWLDWLDGSDYSLIDALITDNVIDCLIWLIWLIDRFIDWLMDWLSCRFILPDSATTVVTPTPGESIRWLVSRLLEKRGLKYTSFDAFLAGQVASTRFKGPPPPGVARGWCWLFMNSLLLFLEAPKAAILKLRLQSKKARVGFSA